LDSQFCSENEPGEYPHLKVYWFIAEKLFIAFIFWHRITRRAMVGLCGY